MRKRSTIALLALAAACGNRAARTDSVAADSAKTANPARFSAESASKTPAVPPASAPTEKPAGSATAVADVRKQGTKTVKPLGAGTPGEDTVRGIISVNGTSRDHHTMLAPTGGGRHLEITGPLATLIGRGTAGADVWVAGTISGTSIAATHFIVRTVDGAPAMDGTLKIENGVTWLVPAAGSRVQIANPPAAFQNKDGVRVWITGDPSRGVASFGFIDPPR